MELVRCPNCSSVYGDLHAECPHCGADHYGEGPEVVFDAATRTALMKLGGLRGGILTGQKGVRVLWCERGVAAHHDAVGHLWDCELGPVESVDLLADRVRVTTRGGETLLGIESGAEEEPA